MGFTHRYNSAPPQGLFLKRIYSMGFTHRYNSAPLQGLFLKRIYSMGFTHRYDSVPFQGYHNRGLKTNNSVEFYYNI